MIYKNTIRDSLRENGGIKEKKEERPKRNYENFFEGYTETFPDGKNKTGDKLKYIYTGTWYSPALGSREYVLNRLLYLLLYICMWLLLIYAAAAPDPVNCTWYVGLAQAFCVFFLGWLTMALIYCFAGGRRMKVYTFKSMTKLFRLSLNGLTGAFAILTGTVILWSFLHRKEADIKTAEGALAYAICLAETVFIRHRENTLQYLESK